MRQVTESAYFKPDSGAFFFVLNTRRLFQDEHVLDLQVLDLHNMQVVLARLELSVPVVCLKIVGYSSRLMALASFAHGQVLNAIQS